MQKDWQSILGARAKWIAAAVIAVTAAILVAIFLPRVLGAPGTVARQFVQALLQAPADAERLRAAGNLADTEDPQAVVEGLSARVALDYLRAREFQGATHDVAVTEAQPSKDAGYVVVLRIDEHSDNPASATRRFRATLQPVDTGAWRVRALTLDE